jgi:hypothetical protein
VVAQLTVDDWAVFWSVLDRTFNALRTALVLLRASAVQHIGVGHGNGEVTRSDPAPSGSRWPLVRCAHDDLVPT